ncbi:cAMP phosphodiesterase [Tieghemostelium lacteum]|uniref:3'5' cyclic nucleotide phosphodiesterase n=1 Tax=Tieghemostelium lacteum TaxID=361077 RepID=H6V7K7_TIELA|nr:3'5' cyclic nucleotide phosphodiesterase [Tieghemostelium lacteum]KYR01930.1 cAMP phosphodiesterase [Tieghemostelium lacteum]|eukprot:KYR01930.1 cAMP phosphodiesterase [Tieghemostelium lacteum]
MKLIGIILVFILIINNIKSEDALIDDDISDYGSSIYSGSFSEKECKSASFITIPLGTAGGLDESNLSSFLITKKGSNLFIALDAGTIWKGISKFLTYRFNSQYLNITYPNWAILPEQKTAWFIKNHILGYFIGHPHLDHVAGLIDVSPEDYLPNNAFDIQPPISSGLLGLLLRLRITDAPTQSAILQKKTIVGLQSTLIAIQNHLFNNLIWPNLPGYGRYDYYNLQADREYYLSDLIFLNESQKEIIKNDFPHNIKLKSYELCHDSIMSTAFLFQDTQTNQQIVFFSDTGVPSSNTFGCDWKQKIYNVWRDVNITTVQAIFIECSFPNSTPDNLLYGHLRPKDIMALLKDLVARENPQNIKNPLKGVKLIIQHIKPAVGPTPQNLPQKRIIYKELCQSNTLGLNIIIPDQGEPICI